MSAKRHKNRIKNHNIISLRTTIDKHAPHKTATTKFMQNTALHYINLQRRNDDISKQKVTHKLTINQNPLNYRFEKGSRALCAIYKTSEVILFIYHWESLSVHRKYLLKNLLFFVRKWSILLWYGYGLSIGLKVVPYENKLIASLYFITRTIYAPLW